MPRLFRGCNVILVSPYRLLQAMRRRGVPSVNNMRSDGVCDLGAVLIRVWLMSGSFIVFLDAKFLLILFNVMSRIALTLPKMIDTCLDT